MSKTLTLRPRLNEKTYGLAASRVYVFDVDRAVNRHAVARAVESQFEVKVSGVKTANISGKSKRVISLTGKRMKNTNGRRSDFKKAYVTLAEGNALPFFEAIEEEEQQEQATQEKFDKALAKQAEKDEKAAKKAAKSETKSDTKSAKPEPRKPAAAKKPAAKPAEPAEKPATATTEAEKPEEPKHKFGLKAWRGFRLRKKNKGDK